MNPKDTNAYRRARNVNKSAKRQGGHSPYVTVKRKTKYRPNFFRILCAIAVFALLVGSVIWLVSCISRSNSAVQSGVSLPVSSSLGQSDVSLPVSSSLGQSSDTSVSSESLFVPAAVGVFDEGGIPQLINLDNPLAEGFVPELISAEGGYSLAPRAAEAYKAMLAAAAEDNISLWIVSAYRSHETQTNNFNNRIAHHKAEGHSDEESYRLTARYIAVPGSSEHEAGLAIDLNSLSSSFDATPEYAWLVENGAKYGFIMRYAKETEAITRIAYEPWHFRYVGSNHATAIQEKGITLEEYVSLMKGEQFVLPTV